MIGEIFKYCNLIYTGTLCEYLKSDQREDVHRKSVATKMYYSYMKGFPGIKTLKTSEINPSKTVFVDCRSEQEREVSIIPGAISLEQFKKQEHTPENDVVFYCTIGYRSAKAIEKLQKDYKNLNRTCFNLESSIIGWLHEGGELTSPNGTPTTRVHVYGKAWDLAPTRFTSVFKQ